MDWKNKISSFIFVLYLLVSGFTMTRHELWGDEVHSWNISKGSDSYPRLIENIRFEGHPPVWYTILWSISRFTHNTAYMQLVQWIIASLVAGLIIFYSPFPLPIKTFLCFGYYFLYEYAVLSRNYGVGVLITCCICLLQARPFKYRTPLYYVLLFLLSNVHLLAMLLAVSIHLYVVLSLREQKKNLRRIAPHALAGCILFLPAAYFIFPPSDSAINVSYWIHRWNIHQLTATVEAPLRAFLPLPAWWNPHFWNTQPLIEAKGQLSVFKIVSLLLALSFILAAIFVLRNSRKSLALFGTNFILSCILSTGVFPLTSARYSGFIFIGFFAACWLHYYERPIEGLRKKTLYAMLVLQMLAGVYFVITDIFRPFSNLYRIGDLVSEVPSDQRLVTDYWTMNAYVAYLDHPAYCVDMGKEKSFVIWGPDMAGVQGNSRRYSTGLRRFFDEKGLKQTYLITIGSPQMLAKADTSFSRTFHLQLVDSRTGAIEKGSDIFLYKITDTNPSR